MGDGWRWVDGGRRWIDEWRRCMLNQRTKQEAGEWNGLDIKRKQKRKEKREEKEGGQWESGG
jgi:hypothetical protein